MINPVADSYFDWEQKFKKKEDRDTKLGIKESEFKKFMKEWKEKQLKKEKNNKEHDVKNNASI
ncbi:MAG: hypothetical protein ACFE8A_13355 [Candidatus Hodarchaeota archaeon]